MQRIVIAGADTPLQKVLQQLSRFPALTFSAIYTEPGRNREVDRLCSENQLAVREIQSLSRHTGKSPGSEEEFECDWFFCVNSTIVFPEPILRRARCGALNMHPGQLPKYAGLHTHQWAIRNGERRFGATLHWMEASVDTGAIAYESDFELAANETGLSLFLKCLDAGTQLVLQALCDIERRHPIPRRPQDATQRHLYRHRDALDGRIDWKQSALQIERFVRAADYGPFQCPTYQPITSTPKGLLSIKKCTLIDKTSQQPPGTVIAATAEGIDVVCGNEHCIRIQKAKCGDDKSMKKLNLGGLNTVAGEIWE